MASDNTVMLELEPKELAVLILVLSAPGLLIPMGSAAAAVSVQEKLDAAGAALNEGAPEVGADANEG